MLMGVYCIYELTNNEQLKHPISSEWSFQNNAKLTNVTSCLKRSTLQSRVSVSRIFAKKCSNKEKLFNWNHSRFVGLERRRIGHSWLSLSLPQLSPSPPMLFSCSLSLPTLLSCFSPLSFSLSFYFSLSFFPNNPCVARSFSFALAFFFLYLARQPSSFIYLLLPAAVQLASGT